MSILFYFWFVCLHFLFFSLSTESSINNWCVVTVCPQDLAALSGHPSRSRYCLPHPCMSTSNMPLRQSLTLASFIPSSFCMSISLYFAFSYPLSFLFHIPFPFSLPFHFLSRSLLLSYLISLSSPSASPSAHLSSPSPAKRALYNPFWAAFRTFDSL